MDYKKAGQSVKSRNPMSKSGGNRTMGGVRVIFFDAVGTLFYLPHGVGFHYSEVACRHGWRLDKEEATSAFRAAWKAMPPRAPTEGPRPGDDRDWWRDLVNRVLDRCSIPSDERSREAYFQELYEEFARPGVWKLFHEVRGVLAELSGRYDLSVISNFDGRLRALLEQFGLTNQFRDLIISSEIGADKPNPLIFAAAIERSGYHPGEALHVGDDAILDGEGAAAAGIRTFILDRPRNSLRDLVLDVGL